VIESCNLLFILSFLLYMYGDHLDGHDGGGDGSAKEAPGKRAAAPAVAGAVYT
jgi:hypothetical protein